VLLKVAIGSDHRGFDLKEELKELLKSRGIEHKDFGTYKKDACDYPDFAFAVAQAVVQGRFDFGILICSTGNGMVIAANKVKGIRAALCLNPKMARMSRAHNDANVLVLSADFGNKDLANDILDVWFKTSFEAGRHARRLEKIREFESKLS